MKKPNLRGTMALLSVLCAVVLSTGCPLLDIGLSDTTQEGQSVEDQTPGGDLPEGVAPLAAGQSHGGQDIEGESQEGQLPEGENVPTNEMTVTLFGNVLMKFVWCPAGTFMMGSPDTEQDRDPDEGPQHQVTLTKGFWMSETEVTQAQWVAIMGSNPSHFTGDMSRPVEMVSWNDICTESTGYLAKLNAANPGYGFRLPTEAEWEYACRAGTTTRFYWGDDSDYSLIADYAWYSENGGDTTHPVGQKMANAWGLKDMSGNAWEWCSDWYGSYASGAATDPTGPSTGTYRILRGGSSSDNYYCRAAFRNCYYADDVGSTPYGFRLVAPAAVN